MIPAHDLSTGSKLAIIEEAREVLKGKAISSGDLEKLHKKLDKKDQFAYATEVLLVKLKQDEKAGQTIPLKEYQTLARYIYKDHALPSSFKFERALRVLNTCGDMATTNSCETLGLAGAIYKRKWQFDHQFKNLILARYYYRKGFGKWKEYLGLGDGAAKEPGKDKWKRFLAWLHKGAKDPGKNDDGYNAINYAYINELMAVDKLEEHGRVTGLSESIYERLREADDTRRFILKQFIKDPDAPEPELKKKDYQNWVIATVAEAYFGLSKYQSALIFIKLYLQKGNIKPWEIRTFHQQLFSMAYLQDFRQKFAAEYADTSFPDAKTFSALVSAIDLTRANDCLAAFDADAAGNGGRQKHWLPIKKDGKLGLALSGGGFRASLFHIGVLAALAEKDELKNVEVLSCVSGGSIIGAYYYLKLKELLETKKDGDIDQGDYIRIVREIEAEFLKGVQKNLRMRLFSNLWCNFKMLVSRHYSRTHRLGELYEKHLYTRIVSKASSDAYQLIPAANKGKIFMHDLLIRPKEAPANFTPIVDNWKRINKVPQLVLNATSVNTGHNWQFTASWMGEPPGNIQADIDAKPRLRRMYYQEAPGRYKQFRLGYAVAASSCVPVMFRPMPMRDLYPDIDLQLIDGGLHDNQGIASLIEQECNNMIISDASGQLPTNAVATHAFVALYYRSDNILQERLRELQFLDIKERNNTTQINRLYTVHLKNDLQKGPLNWKHCEDPPRSIFKDLYENENDLTQYGVLRSVQTSLSEIRTDLDSFHNTEAFALMYSGYRQIHFAYNQQQPADQAPAENRWRFTSIKDFLTNKERAEAVNTQLAFSKKIAFKVFYMIAPWKSALLRILAIIAVVAILIGLGFLAGKMYNDFEKMKEYFWGNTAVTVLPFNLLKWLIIFISVLVLGLIIKMLAALIGYKTAFRKRFALFFLMSFGFVFSNLYLWFLNPVYNWLGKLKR